MRKKKKSQKPAVVGPEKQNIKLHPQAGDNPEFVKQLEDLKKVGPGGAREGAGRPAGSTTEKIASEKMGTAANPAIVGLLKLPFELWAQLTKLDDMALTENEAKLLGLPATQLVNYYLPQTDNPVYLVWASLVGIASYIMLPRLYKLKKIKDEKTVQGTGEAGAEEKGKDAHSTTDGAGAGPSLSAPQEFKPVQI
jgi:hypothetical protein